MFKEGRISKTSITKTITAALEIHGYHSRIAPKLQSNLAFKMLARIGFLKIIIQFTKIRSYVQQNDNILSD